MDLIKNELVLPSLIHTIKSVYFVYWKWKWNYNFNVWLSYVSIAYVLHCTKSDFIWHIEIVFISFWFVFMFFSLYGRPIYKYPEFARVYMELSGICKSGDYIIFRHRNSSLIEIWLFYTKFSRLFHQFRYFKLI